MCPKKLSPLLKSLATATCLLGVAARLNAATFTVSPSAISNTYLGPITLQINGLTNGETVIVDHYADLNSNNVVDAADTLTGRFRITDGQQATIGGKTNVNVPCDLTGTDGAITARIQYLKPRAQFPMGSHFFRLSSPTGNWTPITNSLTITNFPFSQTITGVVTSSSSNVPAAFLAFFAGSGAFLSSPATAAGSYSVRAPSDNYQVFAFKTGYVFNGATAPFFSLGPNVSTNVNLTLIPATTSIAGKLVDATNTSQGIPGIFILLQSAGSLYSFGFTDTNGNFTIPVTPDLWRFSIVEGSGLYNLGYPDITGSGGLQPVDSTTGAVVGVTIPIPKGNTLLYGRMTNSAGAPIAGVEIGGGPNNSSSSIYRSSGVSDTNGNYSIVGLAGDWFANPNTPTPTNYVLSNGGDATLTNNQSARIDFLGVPPSGVITGVVKSVSGTAVSHLEMQAFASVGSFTFNSSTETDATGHYSIPVFNQNWCVTPNCSSSSDGLKGLGYNCVPGQCPTVSSAFTPLNFSVYPLGSAVLTSPSTVSPGYFSFYLNAASGFNYYIQVSTDPPDSPSWQTIQTVNLTSDAPVLIEDYNAYDDQRFYRTVRF